MAIDKFFEAIKILRPDTEMTWVLPIETEEDFNKVQWTVGVDNGKAVSNTSCPHSEITWTLVKAEMDKLDG
jgi:hypothetical protein